MAQTSRTCILALRVQKKEDSLLFFEGSSVPVRFENNHLVGSLFKLTGSYILVNVLYPSGKQEELFLKKEDLKKSLHEPSKNNYLAFQAKRLPSLRGIGIDKEMFNPASYISYKEALEEGEAGLLYFSNLPQDIFERINLFLKEELSQDELTPIDFEILRLLALREVSIKDLTEKEVKAFFSFPFQELLKIIRTKNSFIEFLKEHHLGLDIPKHSHRDEIHNFVKQEQKAHHLKEVLLQEEEKQHLMTLSQNQRENLIPPQFSPKEYACLTQRWKDFFSKIPVDVAENLHKALQSKTPSALSSLSSKEKELLFLLTPYSPEIGSMNPSQLNAFPPHIKNLFESCACLRKLYHPQTEKEREEGLLLFNYLGPVSYLLPDTVFEKINLNNESTFKDLVQTVAQELHKGAFYLFIDGKTVQRLLPLYYYEDGGILQILSYLQEPPVNLKKEQALKLLHCMHQEVFYHQLYCLENRFIPYTREELSWLGKSNCTRTAPQVLRFYCYHPEHATDFRPHFLIEAYYITPYGKDHPFYIKCTSLIYMENGKGWMNLEVGRGLPKAHVKEPMRLFFDLSDTPTSCPISPGQMKG